MRVPEDIEASILEKATHIEEAISILAEKRDLDPETYRSDREQRAIVEREFQTAIEACIDIAGLLMQKATGFRNVLVHQYGNDIDDTEVYEHLQTELGWLVAFLQEVKAYLAEP